MMMPVLLGIEARERSTPTPDFVSDNANAAIVVIAEKPPI
jgi:hypothetical protein